MHVIFVALVAAPVQILVIPNLLPFEGLVVGIDDALLLAKATTFVRVKLVKVVQLSLTMLGNSLMPALFRN